MRLLGEPNEVFHHEIIFNWRAEKYDFTEGRLACVCVIQTDICLNYDEDSLIKICLFFWLWECNSRRQTGGPLYGGGCVVN